MRARVALGDRQRTVDCEGSTGGPTEDCRLCPAQMSTRSESCAQGHMRDRRRADDPVPPAHRRVQGLRAETRGHCASRSSEYLHARTGPVVRVPRPALARDCSQLAGRVNQPHGGAAPGTRSSGSSQSPLRVKIPSVCPSGRPAAFFTHLPPIFHARSLRSFFFDLELGHWALGHWFLGTGLRERGTMMSSTRGRESCCLTD